MYRCRPPPTVFWLWRGPQRRLAHALSRARQWAKLLHVSIGIAARLPLGCSPPGWLILSVAQPRLRLSASMMLCCSCTCKPGAGCWSAAPKGDCQSCPAWPRGQCCCSSVSPWRCRQQPDNIPPAFASAVGGLLELRAQNLDVAIHGQVRPPRLPVRLCLQVVVLQLCRLARCGLLLSRCNTGSFCTSNVCSQAVQAALHSAVYLHV